MASCDHIEVIPMYAEMLLPEFDEEMKSTRKLLECFPEGKSDWLVTWPSCRGLPIKP